MKYTNKRILLIPAFLASYQLAAMEPQQHLVIAAILAQLQNPRIVDQAQDQVIYNQLRKYPKKESQKYQTKPRNQPRSIAQSKIYSQHHK